MNPNQWTNQHIINGIKNEPTRSATLYTLFHKLDWRGAAGAALGGVLMGIGARLSFGCNVGAFTGGAASGSLHGLVWIAAVVPGCWLGIRARSWFGLKRA